VPLSELSGMTTDYVLTGQFNSGTISATYSRRVGERIGLATELDVNPIAGASEARVGMEYTFMRSRIKMGVTTSGRVSSSLLHVLPGGAVHGMLSADIDHAQQEYKFGVGLQAMF
jgi:hypothetical protein